MCIFTAIPHLRAAKKSCNDRNGHNRYILTLRALRNFFAYLAVKKTFKTAYSNVKFGEEVTLVDLKLHKSHKILFRLLNHINTFVKTL